MCWQSPGAPICRLNADGLPLIRPALHRAQRHGDSGLGYARLPQSPAAPASEHAVDTGSSAIMARPGEVTLVAVAPLTNVAVALRKEPRIAQHVREVIIMGGALRADGNTTSWPSSTFMSTRTPRTLTPRAGMPITLLPWDITKDVLLTQADIDRMLRVYYADHALHRRRHALLHRVPPGGLRLLGLLDQRPSRAGAGVHARSGAHPGAARGRRV